MAKIAFFLNLSRFKDVLPDVQLECGNPGIGGTPYLFLLTVKYLNRVYGREYAIMLSDSYFGLDDDDVCNVSVKDEIGALEYCKKNSINTLVINANVADRVLPVFFKTDVKIVLWAHNTVTYGVAKIAVNQKSVHKIVCVSRQQYENMRDSVCFCKCTYINNILPKYFLDNAVISSYSEKKVVYVGSIMPQKGSHNLLEIWKSVEKKVPDAELFVFGGAKIWNPALNNGCLGIGDFFYDKLLNKKLSQLQKPENVHFMGAMGWKNIEQIVKTFRVGVVNPSHYLRDETFCMAAVELAAHGIPVVSRNRCDGLLSTVKYGKTGFLEKKDKQIAKRIIELLCNYEKCRELGFQAIDASKDFIAENEVYKWRDLVDCENDYSRAKINGKRFSRDVLCLWHDLLLKIIYTMTSGKYLYLLKKKFGIDVGKKEVLQ